MTNWDRWCLGLTLRERAKLMCWYYEECNQCPLPCKNYERDSKAIEWLDEEYREGDNLLYAPHLEPDSCGNYVVMQPTVKAIPMADDVLDKIRAEIEELPKVYPFVNHLDTYVKEDDVKKIIDKYREGERNETA